MTKPYAITFPGQGSQSVGMLAELAAAYPVVRQTFDDGSQALGIDLWKLSQEGPKERLNETENTQPALLCAGMAVMRVIEARTDARAVVMAGHSLGEYTALVAAGAVDLADAVRLVAMRGRFMQEAVPVGTGAMAAILGLDDDKVREVCEKGAQGEVASAVNFNSPGQVVVAEPLSLEPEVSRTLALRSPPEAVQLAGGGIALRFVGRGDVLEEAG